MDGTDMEHSTTTRHEHDYNNEHDYDSMILRARCHDERDRRATADRTAMRIDLTP